MGSVHYTYRKDEVCKCKVCQRKTNLYNDHGVIGYVVTGAPVCPGALIYPLEHTKLETLLISIKGNKRKLRKELSNFDSATMLKNIADLTTNCEPEVDGLKKLLEKQALYVIKRTQLQVLFRRVGNDVRTTLN